MNHKRRRPKNRRAGCTWCKGLKGRGESRLPPALLRDVFAVPDGALALCKETPSGLPGVASQETHRELDQYVRSTKLVAG